MKAVHFGAGNIGRGFVGLILHNAGYEVVFADVDAALISELETTPSYEVREVGAGARTWAVDHYRAINSAIKTQELIAEIATADIVTTAVGPNVLRFVAPLVAAGIAERSRESAPLTVMACENAINATDILRDAILADAAFPKDPATPVDPDSPKDPATPVDPSAPGDPATPSHFATPAARAVFANTAVDRIVPGQQGSGLDVTVEAFFEWAIDASPFNGVPPVIPEAHFVDDLAPYIERKLFTVNTGHATAAYHGFAAGAVSISEAMALPEVAAAVRAVLGETKALIVARHSIDPEVQQAYLEKNMARFANPHLGDTVERVGRQPLRKLGRHERFIGPAASLAELGLPVDALLATVAALLSFDVPGDEQSVQLQGLLRTLSPEEFVIQVSGLDASHPLFEPLVAVIAGHQSS